MYSRSSSKYNNMQTVASSRCSDFGRRNVIHSWKCYINEDVNNEYHNLIRQRQKLQMKKVSLRPKSMCPQWNVIREKQSQCVAKTRREISRPKLKRAPSQQATIGVQTNEIVIMSKNQHKIKEEERRYLREKFMEHYSNQHSKKMF